MHKVTMCGWKAYSVSDIRISTATGCPCRKMTVGGRKQCGLSNREDGLGGSEAQRLHASSSSRGRRHLERDLSQRIEGLRFCKI